MRGKTTTFNLVPVFLLWLGFVLACANSGNQVNSQQPANTNNQAARQPATKPFINIPQLIGKSPAELDKVLSKAAAITKITDDPDMMPGEYRDYKVENTTGNVTQEGLMVRFRRFISL